MGREEGSTGSCARPGTHFGGMAEWMESQIEIILSRFLVLSVSHFQSLREKYMKTECIASESLKHVFFGVNGSAKVKPGQSFTKKTGKK